MSHKPIVSAVGWVPDFAKGRVRDLWVRWALAELGLDYDTHLLDASQPRGAEYLAWQPFDQVPAYRDEKVELFESGAILLYIAERHGGLLPIDEAARWQVIAWSFAALNSVEPQLSRPSSMKFLHRDETWAEAACEASKPLARKQLQRLADALADKEWLAGEFSIADILMSTAFKTDDEDLVDEFPEIAAYRDRAYSRAAYKRALEAQLADFNRAPAPLQGA
jgi:glutathione S-transferase